MLRKTGALMPLGGISLSAALLVDRFVSPGAVVDFLIGLLVGLSVALNLVGLYRSRRHA